MCPFLELAKLVGATAETILQTLLEVVDARHLPVEKLFGIATDRATGIATCIKRKIHLFFSMHCIAHNVSMVYKHHLQILPLLSKAFKYTGAPTGNT